jgi:rhodanese-related sulfurtransferase
METIESILETAQRRAREMGLTYKGALLPMEAYRVLQASTQAQLVDVRTRAELDWVGRIPGAAEIELRSYPGMQPNPGFIGQLIQQADQKLPVLFICRSGARSGQAAAERLKRAFPIVTIFLKALKATGMKRDIVAKFPAGRRQGCRGNKARRLPDNSDRSEGKAG